MVKIMLTFYITFVVALAIGSVGDIPTCDGEPYSKALPFLIFLMMAVPAALGFRIGYDEGKNDK